MQKKLVTYLKDEVLFSTKPFTVKEDENSNSIFGLNIEFEEEFENSYELSRLQKELKLIKDSIKQLNKDSIRKKRELDDEATKATREKERQRTLLNKKENELKDNKKNYENNQALAKLNLQKAKDDAVELKRVKNEELQKANALCKIKKEELSSKIEQIKKQIEQITQNIRTNIAVNIVKINEELKESEKILASSIETMKDECNTKIQNSQDELNEALKNNGVDEQLLKNISSEIERFKILLANIKKHTYFVESYLKRVQRKNRKYTSSKRKTSK